MPKIPTYVSTSSMTTATPSVATNLPNLNVNNTPAGALQPVSNYIRDSYIQEKTTEANNKSYKAINSFYEDQLDQQGNVSQKGWLTIQSEAKQKENPTEASEYYDAEVQKLYNYHKNNKLKNLNNFEKKAIDAKFYATSGLLKTKVIGAKKSDKKAFRFLTAIRSNFPKKTSTRHINIKMKLNFLPTL